MKTLPEVLEDPHFKARGMVLKDARGWDHLGVPITLPRRAGHAATSTAPAHGAAFATDPARARLRRARRSRSWSRAASSRALEAATGHRQSGGGPGARAREWPRMADALRAAGVIFEVAETRAAGGGASRSPSARRASYDVVIAAGGDGTVHEVVNGLMRAGGDAAFGVLPLGSGDDFARCSRRATRSSAWPRQDEASLRRRRIMPGPRRVRYLRQRHGHRLRRARRAQRAARAALPDRARRLSRRARADAGALSAAGAADCARRRARRSRRPRP